MLTLDPKYLALVKKILAVYLPDKTIWVYGSRIKGTSHEGSDLDLVVVSTVKPEKISAAREAFSESNLPILVDILDWKKIPEKFKSEIEKTHEVFQ